MTRNEQLRLIRSSIRSQLAAFYAVNQGKGGSHIPSEVLDALTGLDNAVFDTERIHIADDEQFRKEVMPHLTSAEKFQEHFGTFESFHADFYKHLL